MPKYKISTYLIVDTDTPLGELEELAEYLRSEFEDAVADKTQILYDTVGWDVEEIVQPE
jgi:hypothetical protein